MEEKKLTDEEIVKDIERSTGMPSYRKKIVLDLINRSQRENEQLKSENEQLKQEKQLAYDTVNGYSLTDIEQKAEIKRLTAEINQRREMMSKMNSNYATELRNNAELQRLLDKLKLENIELYKERTALIAGSILEKQNITKDTVKDLLIDFNEWINEHYDAKFDAYCVCIPVDKASEFFNKKLKEYGIEVE